MNTDKQVARTSGTRSSSGARAAGARHSAGTRHVAGLWRVAASSLGWAAVALLVASAIIFLSLHYLPGDPATVIGGKDATPDQIAQIRHQYGWDRPLIVQFLGWLGGVLTGDFGTSPLSGKSVSAELFTKLGITIPLALISLAVSVVLALLLGVLAAAKSSSFAGRLLSWLSQIGIAIPVFLLGLVLVVTVAIPSRGALPATGFPRDGWAEPVQALRSLVLPAATLVVPLTAGLTRFVRSTVVDEIHQDYMRTALAQGTPRGRAIWTQALRNAWLPLISVIALEGAGLLTGTVVVEQVFALPGIGQAILAAVSTRDIVTVQGILVVLSGAIILLMMLANLLSGLLDPRVRVSADE